MVGVMARTPVHIRGAGYDAALTLRIVGVVLSLHIAGMFAFAPVTGWLTDRFGRRPVILGAVAVLLVACAVAGTAGHGSTQLAIGLTLLGLGWSGTMVAGSTLLSESVPARLRPSAQGLSDVTMGLAGATAGALSGPVVTVGRLPDADPAGGSRYASPGGARTASGRRFRARIKGCVKERRRTFPLTINQRVPGCHPGERNVAS